MSQEELRKFTSVRPFVPFRIRTTDGQQFDIRHPDMVILAPRVIVIGVLAAGGEYLERTPTVALIRIVNVEPLEAVTAG